MSTATADGVVEGGGIASSFSDLAAALDAPHADPLGVVFASTAAGLDTLGTIAEPFPSAVAAGAGWVIEHFAPFREWLDALAGDPTAVLAQARTWASVAQELSGAAAGFRAATPPGWEGAAADAGAQARAAFAVTLDVVAAQARDVAGLVLGSGAAVGTVRALIRDEIAATIAAAAQWGAAEVASGGVATPAVVAAVAAEAAALGRRITARVTSLADALEEAGGRVGELVIGMRHVVLEARTVAPYLRQGARVLDDVAGRPPAYVAEAGKQFTGAGGDDGP